MLGPRFSPDRPPSAGRRGNRFGSLFAIGLVAGCSTASFWGEDTGGPAAAGIDVSRPAPDKAYPAAELIGLDPASLQRLLGEPRRQRRDAPAQFWQYVVEDCVLDLYLYDEAGGYRVTYVEARTREGEPMGPQACIEAVQIELAQAR